MVNWKLVQQATWWGGAAPATSVSLAAFTYIGNSFTPVVDGFVYGLSHYAPVNSPATHAMVWSLSNNTLIRIRDTSPLTVKAANNWQNVWFPNKYPVFAGQTYFACFLKWVQYFRTVNALTSSVTHGQITFIKGFQSTAIQPIQTTPTNVNNANGIDILFGTT